MNYLRLLEQNDLKRKLQTGRSKKAKVTIARTFFLNWTLIFGRIFFLNVNITWSANKESSLNGVEKEEHEKKRYWSRNWNKKRLCRVDRLHRLMMHVLFIFVVIKRWNVSFIAFLLLNFLIFFVNVQRPKAAVNYDRNWNAKHYQMRRVNDSLKP